ncbi:MAG: hypothetical protein WC436_01545 [Candidatus Babeliales bacterium]
MINSFVKNKTKKILTFTLLASFICVSSDVFAVPPKKNKTDITVGTNGIQAKHTPENAPKPKKKSTKPSIKYSDNSTQTTPKPANSIATQTDQELEASMKMEIEQPEITTTTTNTVTPLGSGLGEEAPQSLEIEQHPEEHDTQHTAPTSAIPTNTSDVTTIASLETSTTPTKTNTLGIQKNFTSLKQSAFKRIPKHILQKTLAFVKEHPVLTTAAGATALTTIAYFTSPCVRNAVQKFGVFAFNKLGQFTGEMQRLQNAHQTEITDLQNELNTAIQHPQCPQIQCLTCPDEISVVEKYLGLNLRDATYFRAKIPACTQGCTNLCSKIFEQ